MIHALHSGPKVVERLMRAFPTDRLDDRLEHDRFSAREVIAHLADCEMVFLDRIRVANLRPGTAIEGFDPGQRAIEHHYSDKDVFHEAEVYESRRMMTIEYLENLTDEDLLKTFVAPSGDAVSIRDFLAKLLAHDLYHIEQLSAYFANEVATIS